MSDVLNKICSLKMGDVIAQKAAYPLSEIKQMIADMPYHSRGFAKSLMAKGAAGKPALIAEIKKSSPSAGLIRDPFVPQDIAKAYESAGAACLSVLTETRYFEGADEYLKAARAATTLPVLRKDFVVDEYQIFESRLINADCILLIVAALQDDQLFAFHELACSLELDVLVEVHNEEELIRALRIPDIKLLGVNNRNLKTLNVDIETSKSLLPLIPDNVVRISESGISQNADLFELFKMGYHGFLVGEHFMRQDDIEKAVCSLLSPV